MYKAIVFDFAETLAHLNPSREKLLKHFVASQTGKHLDTELIARAYYSLDGTRPYSSVRIRTTESRREFYEAFNRDLFKILGISHLADSSEYFDFFRASSPRWELAPGAKALLSELLGKNYRVFLASNFDCSLRDILAKLLMNDARFFEEVFVSQELGVEKPSNLFYQKVVDEIGEEAAGILYVGDSYALDFLPAKEVGLTAYLLDRYEIYGLVDSRVSRLDELSAIIELGGPTYVGGGRVDEG